ncbi:hypothetical protein [Polynucleobacter sp. AP-Nino-20-G2]|uniref:hypothetical protein n=1 Tax=Polynucleobacter sp. AP-Nino-20-G2 TaxID=2576917 RepID=UPI001BFD2C40|nr:hypothetical protein [Polynucleobacter sp. AP-Nino-20-G2]QWE17159.1 hypothetical protein FD960_02760 [Polynucleobacter sp. AP-Nino-20-G2]
MNPLKSSKQLVPELNQAFDRLSVLAEQKEYLNHYIQFLAERMNEVVHSPYPNNFIKKPAIVEPELRQLLDKVADLESYLSQIHQSTILAIPDVTARGDLKLACQKMIRSADIALKSLPKNNNEQPPNTGGRLPKFRALDLANSLAGNYHQLTGLKPSITVDTIAEGHTAKGDFLRLIDDVFGIFDIDGSPEYFAKRAVEHFNSQKDITPLKS